jgi:hypothetical protein
MNQTTAEHKRLADSQDRMADWKSWGPYLSERAWSTVREDYSADGDAWAYFPHDHARSRAYRWNEDGLGGVCNRFQNLCMAVALWNEYDPILKERLFGLTGPEGNHGEDVKEYYYYLDSLPTHSYMKMLYKYPQVEYPYADLIAANQHRSKAQPEVELIDVLGEAFTQGRYFDVFIEYAKGDQEDILCRITAINRGTQPAPIHILPHLWYRNTWSWGYNPTRPRLTLADPTTVYTEHRHLGERWWYVDGTPPLLFTENETNTGRLFNTPNASFYVKDGIHEAVVNQRADRVNPAQEGSKVAAHYHSLVPAGGSFTVRVRLSNQPLTTPFSDFDTIFDQRLAEADDFYATIHHPAMTADERLVQRQAFAGLLWSKQFYHYSTDLWLSGDPAQPSPPASRLHGRNYEWMHLYCLDVLSMPDKWEYPWFAAWDLAFHMLPVAMIDPEWAKRQLILLLREWYMHPNGQLPAYEWNFSDVNPPVHAWAALQVFRIDREQSGRVDYQFLKRVFHKLLLNFTWWVNRKDREGNNIFQGGFLGLDNIGVFDRSAPLPAGGHLEQADGTAWMALFCLNMLMISLELAQDDDSYEDVATKFFEHFIYIANAFFGLSNEHNGLWDEQDGFFYDVLHMPDDRYQTLRVRSFVGLMPLLAVEVLDTRLLNKVPRFRQRLNWFLKYRPQLIDNLYDENAFDSKDSLLLSIVSRERLTRLLGYVFDPAEFLSNFGLRSVSRHHADHPYVVNLDGQDYRIGYEPAESQTGLFGGNSNWRGPIWLPMNYLVVEALRKYHAYYGDHCTAEVPRGSGNRVTLDLAADELSRRLSALFLRDASGTRPGLGDVAIFQTDPNWRDYVLFHEYFHGDTGAGLGASHQTGWTALIARLLHEQRRQTK